MSSNTQTDPPSTMNSQPTTGKPGPDEVYTALSRERRRHALRIIREHEPIKKPDLARHIAAIQYEKALDEVTEAEENRVVTALHQQHLPPLSKHGFVAWDTQNNVVTLGPNSHLLLRHLDLDVEMQAGGKQSIVDKLTGGVL